MSNCVVTGTAAHDPTAVTLSLAQAFAKDGSSDPPDRTEIEEQELRRATGLAHVETTAAGVQGDLIDAPWKGPFDPKIVLGYPAASQAILVSSHAEGADESCAPQLAALCALAGIEEVTVFLNGPGEPDAELVELAELELAELAAAVGAGLGRVVVGDAAAAAECGCATRECDSCGPLVELANHVAGRTAATAWPADGAFKMAIEHVYQRMAPGGSSGRQPIAFGPVRRGTLRAGNTVELPGVGTQSATVVSLQAFGDTVDEAAAGTVVSAVLNGVRVRDVGAPGLLAAPDTIVSASEVTVQLSWHDPAARGYQDERLVSAAGTAGFASAPEVTETAVTVTLESPLALEQGDGILLVSGDRLFATGRVSVG
jgi:elongation factor Tu